MSQNRQINTGPLVELSLDAPLLGVAMDCAPDESIDPHHHNYDQLIYAAAGVITVDTENGIWVVPPARAVWVPTGVTHAIAMSGPVQLRSLYLDPKLAPLSDARCCVVQVSPLLRASILRVMSFPHPYTEEGPEARLVAVILDEIRAAEIAPLHLPLPTDPRARRVAVAFRENPGARRTRKEWAHSAGASERTLERLFHEQTGTSFGKWQQQARLLRALQVIAAGGSILSASLEVGFATQSAFIAMFKRAMGTTPARYFSEPATADANALNANAISETRTTLL